MLATLLAPLVRVQARVQPKADTAVADSASGWLRATLPLLEDPANLRDDRTAFSQEGAVELFHLRVDQALPNGLTATVVQRVFQMRDDVGARFFVLDDLWYDSAVSQFRLVHAQVLRDGKELEGEDGGDLRSGEQGNQPRRILLPTLQAGDRVNLVYELLPDPSDWSWMGGHYLGDLFATRTSYSAEQVEYVLRSQTPLAVSQVGLAPPTVDRDGSEFQWTWRASNQRAFFRQEDGPSLTDRSPFVQVGGFDSWGALAAWYSSVVAQRAALPETQRFVAVSVKDPAETIAKTWAAIAAHLTYRGNEIGAHAFLPAPSAEVLAQQRGDCKDGALLLAGLLRQQGIEAYLAMVRTPTLGEVAPPDDHGLVAATLAAFDHALVYIPGATGSADTWIDTTAPSFLYGELPLSDQGSLALVMRPGQATLMQIPRAGANTNLTRRTVKLTAAKAGGLHAEGTIEVRGADAPSYRRRYADANSRREVLEDWLVEFFPAPQSTKVHVDWVRVAGVSPAQDTVILTFAAELPAAGSYSSAWIARHYEQDLAGLSRRDDTLYPGMKWTTEEDWSVDLAGLSPGAANAASSTPGALGVCAGYSGTGDVSRQSEFGEVEIQSSCAQGELHIHSRVVQAAEMVQADQYAQYRGFWQTVDMALSAPLWSKPQSRIAALP